ncbi:MAG TPA: acyltransferase, partial [Arcobacter sp.]|nr:acyltransferase [Arcobacter sp.]
MLLYKVINFQKDKIMLIYKIINKIYTYYKRYALKCQNKILKENINYQGGTIGKNVKFGYNVTISSVKNITIGENVHIGSNGFIRAEGGVAIGNNVFISRNLTLYSNSHNYNGKRVPFDETNINKPVLIEDNVWIGMNVTIAPGSII